MEGFGKPEAVVEEDKEKLYTPFTPECVIPFMGGTIDSIAGTDAITSPPDIGILQETFKQSHTTPLKTSWGTLCLVEIILTIW